MHLEPQALMQKLDVVASGPHVVAIGGGKGLGQVLTGVVKYARRVDAVVTVADDGGSSGRLVEHIDIPPPGDMRKSLIALTPGDSIWKRLFEYRFEDSDVAGHSLGNLLLAGLADIEGSFEQALVIAELLLGAAGSVIPAAGQRLHLEIESDGVPVRGQVAVSLHRGPVDTIRVVPDTVTATPRAIEAIESADQIILGPGSLLTSTIAALLVPGITEAINRSPAHLIYVANLVTQDGESLGLDAIDHLDALIRLSRVRPPRTIVANNRPIDVAPPLQRIVFDPELTATYGADLVLTDLVADDGARPMHDPEKLGAALSAITP